MFNSVSLFAGEESGNFFSKYLVFDIINFTLFVWLLYHYLKQPIRDYFKNRRSSLAKEIEESDKMLKDAESELEKYEKAISELDSKIEEIKQIAKSTTEREQQAILTAAKEYSVKIKEEAEKIASQEVEKAVLTLRNEISKLSVEMAEDNLKNKIDKSLNEQIISGIIDKIEVN